MRVSFYVFRRFGISCARHRTLPHRRKSPCAAFSAVGHATDEFVDGYSRRVGKPPTIAHVRDIYDVFSVAFLRVRNAYAGSKFLLRKILHNSPTAIFSARVRKGSFVEKNHRLHGDFVSYRGYHSHSIVAGGLVVMSYTTRLTPLTSLTIRDDAARSTS